MNATQIMFSQLKVVLNQKKKESYCVILDAIQDEEIFKNVDIMR